jgi:glycerol-3-phosphate dehydrogenase
VTGGFDVTTRAENLRRMQESAFDLLVIGGGIVGASVARDAATRGLVTALVERGDFASGTSGKTSRLVHGGLRYLRNYRVGLVRTAVRERDVLLERAPALVRPLQFLIPSYRDRGPRRWALRFGLFVYDFLSKGKTLPRRVWLRPAETTEREPRLATRGLEGSGIYYDAWTDDARLVLAVVREAASKGAAVANYAEVTGLTRTAGRVDGAHVVDRLTEKAVLLRARNVVNATGVWLDRLRTPPPTPTIRPTKGIHIFLPRARVGNRNALALTARRDGRVIFVLPWDDLTLVGTTDTDFQGDPDSVLPDAHDVAYLLEAVNEAFPDAHVTTTDVVSAYAGLRPLARRGRKDVPESEVSREHVLFRDSDGLISIVGGKLTTARAMAESVVGMILPGGRTPPTSRGTRDLPLGPEVHPLDEFIALGFDEDSARRLQYRFAIQELKRHLGTPSATQPIVEGLPHVWVEIDIAVQEEMALTLSDVLVRRLGLFYEASDQGSSVAPEVASRIAPTLGWSAEQVDREVRDYHHLIAAHRRFLDDGG